MKKVSFLFPYSILPALTLFASFLSIIPIADYLGMIVMAWRMITRDVWIFIFGLIPEWILLIEITSRQADVFTLIALLCGPAIWHWVRGPFTGRDGSPSEDEEIPTIGYLSMMSLPVVFYVIGLRPDHGFLQVGPLLVLGCMVGGVIFYYIWHWVAQNNGIWARLLSLIPMAGLVSFSLLSVMLLLFPFDLHTDVVWTLWNRIDEASIFVVIVIGALCPIVVTSIQRSPSFLALIVLNCLLLLLLNQASVWMGENLKGYLD